MPSIPVFMYHHVAPNPGDMITVTPEVFDGQMAALQEGGYKTLSLDETAAFIAGTFTSKEKCCVITFDDGYLDNYIHAWPVLRRYGIRAAIFLVTGWVDRATETAEKSHATQTNCPNHAETKRLITNGEYGKVIMTWPMARQMQDESNGLVEFHSHTADHCDCATTPPDELLKSLTVSKAAVERELGRPCNHLCWPKGRYNQKAVELADVAGYMTVCTTRRGATRPGSDPLFIPRIAVKKDAAWLRKQLYINTNPLMARIYAILRNY